MRRALPSLVTATGLVLGLVGIALGPANPLSWPLLAGSLGADVVDGALARALGVASDAGSLFDLAVDVALAHAMLFRVVPGGLGFYASALLAIAEIIAFENSWRFSGRTLAWVGCVAWAVLR